MACVAYLSFILSHYNFRSRCWTKDPWQKQPVIDKGLVAKTFPQMACVVYLSFISSHKNSCGDSPQQLT